MWSETCPIVLALRIERSFRQLKWNGEDKVFKSHILVAEIACPGHQNPGSPDQKVHPAVGTGF